MKLPSLFDGLGVKLKIFFGGPPPRSEAKKAAAEENKHCVYCRDKKKDHPGKWCHDFHEFE